MFYKLLTTPTVPGPPTTTTRTETDPKRRKTAVTFHTKNQEQRPSWGLAGSANAPGSKRASHVNELERRQQRRGPSCQRSICRRRRRCSDATIKLGLESETLAGTWRRSNGESLATDTPAKPRRSSCVTGYRPPPTLAQGNHLLGGEFRCGRHVRRGSNGGTEPRRQTP